MLDVSDFYKLHVGEVVALDLRLFWPMYVAIPERHARRILAQTQAIAAAFSKDGFDTLREQAFPPRALKNETAAGESKRIASWIRGLTT